MKPFVSSIFVVILAIFFWYTSYAFSANQLDISGIAWGVKDVSIVVDHQGNNVVDIGQSFGMRILGLMKVVVSGFALVFMVMIGVYMVVFSENEEKIKTQRRQIVYVLIGFLFLNIPWVVYQVLSPADASGSTIGISSWTDTSFFWYTANLPWFVGSLVGFFRVFAYGIAILMLTWGFFRLILSSGEEEQVKSAKSRVIYSSLALMFLLFVDTWVRAFTGGNLSTAIPGVAGTLFQLALFFAAPTAIFFIIYGAYYYITSAWDEERVKKWKNILMNTFIASLILIAAFSFLSDLIKFSF